MILLRQTRILEDSDQIISLKLDSAIQDLLMSYPTFFKDDPYVWLKNRIDENRILSICLDDVCIGYVMLNKHNAGKYLYFGYCIDRRFQGNGYGFDSLKYIINYGIEQGFRKVLLEVRTDNTKAIKIYSKFGFREVGIFEKHYISIEDKYVDVLIMEYICG